MSKPISRYSGLSGHTCISQGHSLLPGAWPHPCQMLSPRLSGFIRICAWGGSSFLRTRMGTAASFSCACPRGRLQTLPAPRTGREDSATQRWATEGTLRGTSPPKVSLSPDFCSTWSVPLEYWPAPTTDGTRLPSPGLAGPTAEGGLAGLRGSCQPSRLSSLLLAEDHYANWGQGLGQPVLPPQNA